MSDDAILQFLDEATEVAMDELLAASGSRAPSCSSWSSSASSISVPERAPRIRRAGASRRGRSGSDAGRPACATTSA